MKQEAIDWWKNLPDDEKQLVTDIYYTDNRKHSSLNATQVYLLFRHFELEEEFE